MSSKRPSSSSSAAVIEGNEDLLTEILLFLPAKSLIRSKLVSKRWKSLISSPSFCRLHTVRRRPEPQTSFLFGCERTSKYVICDFTVTKLCQFHFRLAFPKVMLLQSCNALLLLMCEECKERRYYVFNPTTLQQRDLSPLPCGSIDSIYIIFDPSSSVDYKVVCFESVKNSTVFYVYYSETHKWSDGVKLSKRVTSFRNGVSFNGGIYFVRLGSASRFDLDGSVSKIDQAPSRATGIHNRKYALESNGFLFCLTFSWRYGAEGVILHVSEMEKGKESRWSYKHRIDMCTILGEEEDSVDFVQNVYMIRGEREEDLMLLLSARSRVVIYRFCDHSVDVVVDIPVDELKRDDPRWFLSDAHHFIETLAPDQMITWYSIERELSPLPWDSIESIYIIFDPSSSLDYRVVCFRPETLSTVFCVYDSETRNWSGVKRTERVMSFRSGVSFNGGIYFVRPDSASRFDLAGNVSEILQVPSRRTGIHNRKYAVESNGFLFCLTFSWWYGAEGVNVT